MRQGHYALSKRDSNKKHRQISVLSAEEIIEIAAHMGLDNLDPLVWRVDRSQRIPDFTHIPPVHAYKECWNNTDRRFGKCTCNLPAREIENEHPGFGKAFKAAAMGRRA